MNLIASLFVAALLGAPVLAADFWVVPAPGGTGGNGSIAQPYRSLTQAAKRAQKGDTIHLMRGTICRESGIAINDATLVADGPSDQPPPVVTGAVPITGFKPLPENSKILTAPCSEKPAFCAADGTLLTLARFPNNGFLSTKAGTTATAIVDGELAKRPGDRRWKGAQVRWRKWSWWWETRAIVDDEGGRLQLGPTPVADLAGLVGIGSGYYIDDCRAELDAPGEWWFDAEKKQLLVIPPVGADASKFIVEAAVAKTGLSLSNATIKGITVRHFTDAGVTIGRLSTVEDCHFQQIRDAGLASHWDSAGSTVRNCAFTDILNIGINWIENPAAGGGSVIERNRLERIGMNEGLGGSGPWHAVGIIISNGKAVNVRLNTVRETGYAGIILGVDGQIVERNVFARCMSTMNDGAAIYANCNASVIRENIILNTVGNLHTSQPFYPLGHGIWPEFLKEFHDTKMIANTIVGCGGNGIFMPNNFSCEVRDNVLAGNRLAGISLGIENNINRPQGHSMTGNVLVVDPRFRPAATLNENIPADWKSNDRPFGIGYTKGIDYGTMKGTVAIAVPGCDLAHADGKGYKEAAAWKAEAPWADPALVVVRGEAVLLINDTEQSVDMPAPPGAWATTTGGRAGSSVRIEPFRSSVLIGTGPVSPAIPPYTLASGRNFSLASLLNAPAVATVKRSELRAADATVPLKPAVGAVPVKVLAKPTEAGWNEFVGRLRERVVAQIKDGRSPRFFYNAMKSEVQLLTLVGDDASIKIGSGTIQHKIFEKIAPEDALALSRAVLRQGTAEDHAIVAFFARCAGNTELYEAQITLAGAAAQDATMAFPAP